MDFLKYSKVYFIISGTLVLTSIVFLLIFGLNLGIDFSGGSMLEIEYAKVTPSLNAVRDRLVGFNFEQLDVQPTGKTGFILRVKQRNISKDVQKQILRKLEELGEIKQKSPSFETISPTVGRELTKKTQIVVILCLVAILIYVALAFRKISRPVASWQYGTAALIALFHDVLIPVGVFSVLGRFWEVQMTIPIVTALLTIFGYSVNDTVVIFDRTREHLLRRTATSYYEAVNKSLNQTLVRSVNTSLTTLFVLFAIFFLGGETLKYFSLALIIGIVCGTYSSIFLASPFLVQWLRWKRK